MKLVKILAASLVLASGVAFADQAYTTFEYTNSTKRSDDTSSVKGGLVVGLKTDTGRDFSLKYESSQAEIGNGSISTGLEVRARQNIDLGTFKPYVGIRLGEKLTSTTSFAHYAFDGGVKFPIVGALSGDVGARFRNAFDTVNDFDSKRAHAAVSYAVTKNDSVALRYSKSYGADSEAKNDWRLSYSHAF
jgi:hypothetical protein